MPVTETKQTPEERDAEARDVESKRLNVSDAILSSLDLPTDEELQDQISRGQTNAPKAGEKAPEKKPEEEPAKKPDKVPEEEELTGEEILKTPDEELTDEGIKVKRQLEKEIDDDELIPKSKVNKRFQELTKEIKDLRTQLEGKTNEKAVDPDIAKLNKKSPDDLRQLKRAVRAKMRVETDEKQLADYDELEEKIDDALHSFPQRFQQRQVDAYNKVADEIEDDPEIKYTKEVGLTLKKLAYTIFQKYPRLQNIEDGQAMALRFAVDHFKANTRVAEGDQETKRLKKFTAKLKKKTTLDSNGLKRDKGSATAAQSKERAHAPRATTLAKADFIKNDPLFNIDSYIPDSFKGR